MTTHWSPGLNIARCNVWTAAIQNSGWCSATKTSALPRAYRAKHQHLPSSDGCPPMTTSALPKTYRPKHHHVPKSDWCPPTKTSALPNYRPEHQHPPSRGWYPATKTTAPVKAYRPNHWHLPFYQPRVSGTSPLQYRMHGRKHSKSSSSDVQPSRKRQHANVRPK